MKKRTCLLIAILCGAMFASSAVFAVEAAEPVTLGQIIKAVQVNEVQLNDCMIEYTTVRKLYNADKRELTSAEVAKMDLYPGHYLPEQGVLSIKGKKIRLERNPYHARSKDTEGLKVDHTLAYDGDITRTERADETKEINTGVVAEGRTHLFRAHFNPILMYSASGDMSLSEELETMDAELVPGLTNVGNTPCQVIKLFEMAYNNTILRTFKAYLDPARNYALLKVEQFWYDFQCLEKTMGCFMRALVHEI